MNLRLLLLEDDAVSAAFLAQVLAGLGLRVLHAADLATARRLADPAQALWLFDARLPDGHGADLLPELRARGMGVPALALTASEDPVERERLARAGFAEVLGKPIGSAALQAAVLRHVPARQALPRWDDTAALLALGGQRESVAALRRLFLQELPAQRAAIGAAVAVDDPDRVRELLHRLKAGCGFVGAAALLAAVRARDAAPLAGDALARVVACSRALEADAAGLSPDAVAPTPTAVPTT